MHIFFFQVELLDWEPENLSGKKDKGILRYPIKEGNGFDSPKESSNVESKFLPVFLNIDKGFS